MSTLRLLHRLRVVLLFVGILAMLAGCNVAGYEEKMKNEKAKLDNFDKENDLLDEPIEEPKNDKIRKGNTTEYPKDDQGKELSQPPAIFFRPPKGIGRKYKRDAVDDLRHARTYGELFYIYPRTKGPFTEVLVAVFSDPKNEYSKDLLRQLPGLLDPATKSRTKRFEPFLGRPPMQFEERRTENDTMLFYFMQEKGTSVAIVFIKDKAVPGTTANEAVEASLRSLAVGTDYNRASREFGEQNNLKGTIITPAATASQSP